MKQLGIRIEEVKAVIQELNEMSCKFHQELFGICASAVKVEMSELLLAGHSFGAMTAISTAAKLSEKA